MHDREQRTAVPCDTGHPDAAKVQHVAAVTDLEDYRAERIERAHRALHDTIPAPAPPSTADLEILEDRIHVRVDALLEPGAARTFALQLLAGADEIESVGPGDFGYDPRDTEALYKLRQAIDKELPIPDDQALEGDYVEAVCSAGRVIRRQIARAVKLHGEAKRG